MGQELRQDGLGRGLRVGDRGHRLIPQIRRRFLDSCICQLRPRYAQALAEYKRLYQHKTRILKDAGEHPTAPHWAIRREKSSRVSSRAGCSPASFRIRVLCW